ncbi:MAG: molecular chaperone DnaJ [Clostridiaceae bacterium]|nr:molecular chaperone DnaJ [Clostridiaceae bacterium]
MISGNDQNIKNSTGSGWEEFTSSNSPYVLIRKDILSGDLKTAEDNLNKMSQRDAEWEFSMGVICSQKGWYDNAYTYLNNACTQEPLNKEYDEAFNKLKSTNKSYRETYYNRGDGNDGTRDSCLRSCGQDYSCECCANSCELCECGGEGCDCCDCCSGCDCS